MTPNNRFSNNQTNSGGIHAKFRWAGKLAIFAQLVAIMVFIICCPLTHHGWLSYDVELIPAAYGISSPGPAQSTGESSKAIHVILFIADGMSYENEMAASIYLYGEYRALAWQNFPNQCYVTTWDIDTYNRYAKKSKKPRYTPTSFDPYLGYDPSHGGIAPWPIDLNGNRKYFLTSLHGWSDNKLAQPATDSAAAATAIATGYKTDSGNVAWAPGDPPDGALITIAQKMRKQLGSSIGIVSTVQFSHATLSPFVANNTNRGNTTEIANEIIRSTKPEVVIGGGHPSWSTGYISSKDLNYLRNSPEYFLVEKNTGINGGKAILRGSELAKKNRQRLFGLFGGSKGCFEPPKPVHRPGSPGFNESEEDPSLAEAALAALTVLSSDPDGFFLLIEQGDLDWANHYNDYHHMLGAMWSLECAVAEVLRFVEMPDDSIDWSNTLVMITADHATGMLRIPDHKVLSKGYLPAMKGKPYHYKYPGGEVTWGTTDHTNELVTFYAIGDTAIIVENYVGKIYQGLRIIDNTDINKIMLEATGLK